MKAPAVFAAAILNWPLRQIALLLMLAPAAPCAFAGGETPDALLHAVTAEVRSILRQATESGALTRGSAAELAETRILPLFDFQRMTRIAMARNWRLASAEQQAMLIAEFKTLLVRTFTVALSLHPEPAIEFRRMRMPAGESEARVKSEVRQPGMEHIAIDYHLEMSAAGWKVYDIKIGGVSMIATYRETFAEMVRHAGVDGIIKSLADKNRQAGSGLGPARPTLLEQSRIAFAMLQSALQGRR